MPFVDSTAISRVEYDPADKELLVTFRPSRETYTYFHVPPETYEDLLNAPSLGTFFNEHIRENYDHVRHRSG